MIIAKDNFSSVLKYTSNWNFITFTCNKREFFIQFSCTDDDVRETLPQSPLISPFQGANIVYTGYYPMFDLTVISIRRKIHTTY